MSGRLSSVLLLQSRRKTNTQSLLFLLQFRPDNPVGLVRCKAAIEETVDAFEWDVLGFGDQEVDKYGAEEHQSGEEKVHSVTHGLEHLGCETGDEEVPKPVVCCG